MEAKAPESKFVGVKVPDKTYRRAEQYVKDGGAMSISELIRTALDQKLIEVGY